MFATDEWSLATRFCSTFPHKLTAENPKKIRDWKALKIALK